MKYKLKQISLAPDRYGQHIVIKMVTKYDDNGKYVKHIPLNEETVSLLKNGFVMEDKDG